MVDVVMVMSHNLVIMKYKICSISLALVAGTVALFISSCASDPANVATPGVLKLITIEANEEARKYNLVLVNTIENADKIVITEHSHKVDFFGTIPGLENTPHYSYARKVLSAGEQVLFLANVRNLKGLAKSENTSCLFVPHHTLDFYEEGLLKSSMQICYKCSDITWNATHYKASEDVFQALTIAITGAGMQTHRTWDEIAKQRYIAENQAKPPGIDLKLGGVPVARWAVGERGKKVINPFTGKLVDVEGITANTKVRDPNDKDPAHIFKVPAE